MKQELALKVLGKIMDWSDDDGRKEFAWLEYMARFKYDAYRDYVAGGRFLEALADWLQQFETSERAAAYEFVRRSLLFFSATEIQHLIELTYPEVVKPTLVKRVAAALDVTPYLLWSDPKAKDGYDHLLRRTLFFGLSDGARIDVFRRANAGIVSNEQVLLATEISDQKWASLLADLRSDQKDQEAKFSHVFLLDDFAGTGKTLIREEDGKWTGRLAKFWNTVEKWLDTHFDSDYRVYVHHYIAAAKAVKAIEERFKAAKLSKAGGRWFGDVTFSYGIELPQSVCVSQARHAAFMTLIDRYYDASLKDKHKDVGGGEDIKLGFGQAALPLILEHNTPNDSVPLLWAETDGKQGVPMRPLFRRRERHSDLRAK
jgi:hypothetical protein